MLSLVAAKDSRELHVHLDRGGIAALRRIADRAESMLATGRTDHLHLFSNAWAPDGELSQWMPKHETEAGADQVHHLKIYFHSAVHEEK